MVKLTTNDLIDLLRTADPEGNRQVMIDGCFYGGELYNGDLEIELYENEYNGDKFIIIK